MAAILTALLMLLGATAAWGGAAWLITTVPPTQLLAPVALYVFLFTGCCTTAALAAWVVLKPRDRTGALRPPAIYLGHAMLLAAIALFALWLQSLRALTPVVAVLLAALYGVLELGLLFGTRGAVDVQVAADRPDPARV